MKASSKKSFESVRRGVVGINATIETPYGKMPLLYADWTATGRLYKPIEDRMVREFGPYIGNTHTTASATGRAMTELYTRARESIKKHFGANGEDALIAYGSGMTGAVVALQDMLGLRPPRSPQLSRKLAAAERPVVFVTHMEHHSNHTTWLETIADVEVIAPDAAGLPDHKNLEELLLKYKDRPLKIAAITAASNVTGAIVDIHAIAAIVHAHGGYCFVDCAAAAPYLRVTMHPKDSKASLDAIYFSPHKFLGGTGTPGILIFSKKLYKNAVPLRPGGGTVRWTNPWGGRSYLPDIEMREDGGTPPFWGVIKASLALSLQEEMGVSAILRRERELVSDLSLRLTKIPGLHILAPDLKHRLCILSCTVDNVHYNLVVKLLSDRFGIQTRGGCACAGTYGHVLFDVSREASRTITERIDACDESLRPGFVRISLHPTTTNAEVRRIADALSEITKHGTQWARDYSYDKTTNEFSHKQEKKYGLHLQL